eukprot:1723217-Prymnesium_polylepis.1
MEPALDPAQEAQAAGRIHRLGQTKEILIKRFGNLNCEHALRKNRVSSPRLALRGMRLSSHSLD